MKKKMFLLVVMLVALFSVKEVNASAQQININESRCSGYLYSIKQNKLYYIPNSDSMSCAEAIEGKIDQDELVDGNSLISVSIYVDNEGCPENIGCKKNFLLTQKGNMIISDYDGTCIYGENSVTNPECIDYHYSSLNDLLERGFSSIVKKGTIVIARSVTANGKTDQFFYTDKDYEIKSYYSGYNSYFVLEPLDDESDEPNDPDVPNEQVDDYKLDLKCLSDKDESHHCELYYNRVSSESNESNFEVKFRVQAKNIKGQITINDETEELESDKEYTVNGECNDADCKVLLAKFNTKDVNRNSSSSMEIEPVSLKIDGEDKPINIENSKCEYSKVIENPKTSTYIILVATIIFIVFAGLLIVLRKKEVLTKV